MAALQDNKRKTAVKFSEYFFKGEVWESFFY